jgi:hypothetical protein
VDCKEQVIGTDKIEGKLLASDFIMIEFKKIEEEPVWVNCPPVVLKQIKNDFSKEEQMEQPFYCAKKAMISIRTLLEERTGYIMCN